MGKPTSYKTEYCQDIIEHFKTGKSYAAFAASINVHRGTLHDWEAKHPEFADAKSIGWEHYQAWWEAHGEEGIYNQTFMEPDGSKRSVSINAAVWIYNMKCRFKKDWSETKEIQADVTYTNTKEQEEVKEFIERYKKLKEME